jgi:hypothetical protein
MIEMSQLPVLTGFVLCFVITSLDIFASLCFSPLTTSHFETVLEDLDYMLEPCRALASIEPSRPSLKIIDNVTKARERRHRVVWRTSHTRLRFLCFPARVGSISLRWNDILC